MQKLNPSSHHTQAPQLRDEERQRCEVWTRVMGYHRPVSSFNTGKQGEFRERLHFEESRVPLAD
jgi:anaerobic ribonucleoside-triphosphate reductase